MGALGNRGNRTPVDNRTLPAHYNPHGWAGGIPFKLVPPKVQTTTAFEDFVAELGTPQPMWHQDRRIIRWVHAHKNHRYIPEHLLDALGEKVLDDGYPI